MFYSCSCYYPLFLCITGDWTQGLLHARQTLYHFIYAPSHFFSGTGLRTKGLVLAKQAHYHLSHTSSPFCSWVVLELEGGFLNFFSELTLNHDPPDPHPLK
jgi:hypothetical protein